MQERWATITYNGVDTDYQISDNGDVISFKWNKRKYVSKHLRMGYQRVSINVAKTGRGIPINRKSFSVHRLVAEKFVENLFNFPEINHINGVKTDNHYSNLEWCDRTHNIRHAFANGLNNGKSGGENNKARPVAQYSNGVQLKTYDCIRDAMKDGFHESCVGQCARGVRSHHKGFQWKFI